MRVAENENTQNVIAGKQVIGGRTLTGRITSNFLWSIISEATAKGVFFITNIYLARTLDVSTFGVFIIAQTITLYFWLAVDLGTSMYGIREIAKNKGRAEEIINPLLTLRITAGFVVFSLYATSLLFLNMPALNKLTFAGCGLYLLTYALYSDWVLKGLEKFRYIAFGSFVSSIVFLVGILYFVKRGEDIVKASFIWSFSYLLGSMSLLYFIYVKLDIRYRPFFNLSTWLSHMRESIYFTISGVLTALYPYLPILLLGIFFTSREVGLFSASYRVVIAIATAGFLLPMAFYPAFSELYIKDRVEFQKTHRNFQKIMSAISLPVACIGTIFGKDIVMMLFGKQFIEGVTVFKMLIWLVPLYFLRYTYGIVLLAAGFQRSHNIATFMGALCMGISGLYLVPRYDIAGGALSLLISEIVILGSMALIFYFKIKGGADGQRTHRDVSRG